MNTGLLWHLEIARRQLNCLEEERKSPYNSIKEDEQLDLGIEILKRKVSFFLEFGD